MRRVLNYILINMQLLLTLGVSKVRKYIFIINTPLHNNIGDQAITVAEIEYLKNKYPDAIVKDIPGDYIDCCFYMLKLIIGKEKVYIHGGGYIGSLWKNENDRFVRIIRELKDNKIVVFPQSAYFKEDDIETIELTKTAVNNCKNITIFTRDRYSLETLKRLGFLSNNQLVPDIVLSSDKLIRNCGTNNKKTILLCLRSDGEQLDVGEESLIKSIKAIKGIDKYSFIKIDTITNKRVSVKNRYSIVNDLMDNFAEASLVITDRLHGMVLSTLAGTPVLIIDNISKKVTGQYEWLKDIANVSIWSETITIEDIDMIVNERKTFDNLALRDAFLPLAKEV